MSYEQIQQIKKEIQKLMMKKKEFLHILIV